jgi:hypothetical protein
MRGRVRVGGCPREEREKEGDDRFRVFVLGYLFSLHSEYLGLHRLTWTGLDTARKPLVAQGQLQFMTSPSP